MSWALSPKPPMVDFSSTRRREKLRLLLREMSTPACFFCSNTWAGGWLLVSWEWSSCCCCFWPRCCLLNVHPLVPRPDSQKPRTTSASHASRFDTPVSRPCGVSSSPPAMLQVVRIVGQMVGGFYAFPIMAKLLPSYATSSMGGPTLAAGASTGQGMAWEFGSTFALILIVYVAATQVIVLFTKAE